MSVRERNKAIRELEERLYEEFFPQARAIVGLVFEDTADDGRRQKSLAECLAIEMRDKETLRLENLSLREDLGEYIGPEEWERA